MYTPRYFTLEELCKSATAKQNRIQNTPSWGEVENLNRLCELVLDPLRKSLGEPIFISSGFRCPELNRLVGGVVLSQHINGLAADITCRDKSKALSILKNNPNVDQCINEKHGYSEWIHVSIPTCGIEPRRQFFSINK